MFDGDGIQIPELNHIGPLVAADNLVTTKKIGAVLHESYEER